VGEVVAGINKGHTFRNECALFLLAPVCSGHSLRQAQGKLCPLPLTLLWKARGCACAPGRARLQPCRQSPPRTRASAPEVRYPPSRSPPPTLVIPTRERSERGRICFSAGDHSRKLSPAGPIVLRAKVWESRSLPAFSSFASRRQVVLLQRLFLTEHDMFLLWKVQEFLTEEAEHVLARLAVGYADRGYTTQYSDQTLTWPGAPSFAFNNMHHRTATP